jgi:hypothetical protein
MTPAATAVDHRASRGARARHDVCTGHAMSRAATVSVLVLLLAAAACGGQSTGTGAPEAGAGGDDGGGASGCPAVAPSAGSTCGDRGLVCTYPSDGASCGTFTCDDAGAWSSASRGGGGCPLPPGLVCPTEQTPTVTGTKSPIDRACTGDGDCAAVTFATDCCGDAIALGVRQSSVAAAQEAAATCGRAFPACGCPARPPVAETGTSDGGAPVTIEAFCASGTCRTRYR